MCVVLSDYDNVGSFLLSIAQQGNHCVKPPLKHEPLRCDYLILGCWLCYFSPYISVFFPPPLDVCCLQFDMRFSHVSAIALEWIMPFCCLIPYFYLFLKSCEKKTSEKCWKLCFYLTTKQFLVTSKTSSWVLFRCRSVDINLKDCCGYKRQGFAPTVWTAFKVTDRTSWSSELTEFIAGGQNCHGIWGSPSAFPYLWLS